MALTNNALPTVGPTYSVPYDAFHAFAFPQTLTATAYASGVNTQVDLGRGRFQGLWVLDITAATLSADQAYQFFLCGSNDAAFADGNFDVLASRDIAYTQALRLLPSKPAAFTALGIPAGQACLRHVIPFSNQMGAYLFQFAQLYVKIAGTSPSITFRSWLAPDSTGSL